eukprot:CAMPEP_0114990718 /NCGR_PEP_ID=MMETSP0216-20121206/10962_1 /TAXON_ID=223996 /ORGANISM="Protocruzia adherens, Strain Boccale" /LENGTH=408 /DNA_ID=CAMNT_0002353945 /DNA_START=27 /DNA_END=1253 /DNA_ORIENTATION=+
MAFWKKHSSKTPGSVVEVSVNRGENGVEEEVKHGEVTTPGGIVNGTTNSTISNSSDSTQFSESGNTQKTPNRASNTRVQSKYEKLLSQDVIDVNELRKLAWNGLHNVDSSIRSIVWSIILGYLPVHRGRQGDSLNQRRDEYRSFVEKLYKPFLAEDISEHQRKTLVQVRNDVPRTNPEYEFFHEPKIRDMIERILIVWACRHPASGYVQGINDLCTPFVIVFLENLIEFGDDFKTPADFSSLTDDQLMEVEADSFWCLCRILKGIQDHYTTSQPGIQRMMFAMEDLIKRIDTELHEHFKENSLQFLQFAFRWINCFLMREISLRLTLRLWDTYISETEGFAVFHRYVCVALITRFKKELMECCDQADLIMFLQKIPTQNWTEQDLNMVLAQAYTYKTLYDTSPSHLNQ